ncbi:AMP phosphorylase [Archaeoglobus sulfaticallidus PM70-1]|uniref:AMP phosphorylase n=1 Tax=Archaeoglobus sulfaticallidus PM70-1 TaxID=387631 RepID=N0BM93_9EURY|nr:AMP phosphorylase [Archaeoglobus sulfaticallidus]AGK61741.1 AMP phosphorylase [Archaeoglobus sulfaticallidus PM70-1]
MKLKVKLIPFYVNDRIIAISENDAKEIGVRGGDRVRVSCGRKRVIAEVKVISGLVEQNECGLTKYLMELLEIEEEAVVEIFPVPKPESFNYIRKKIFGHKLTKDEIYAIIKDTVDGSLNEVELTAFVASNMLRSMDFDEIEWMTRAMIETGETITFERGIVVDKHSIGGVPGNKITLLIVPIVASSGLLIPKTASRAITSATGTADTFEVLADVNLTVDEIKEITERVGRVIAWGGATEIAPADDIIIRVEHPLSIDPKPQLLASVMAKKGSVGAKHVVIDIPVGKGSKVPGVEKGRELANDFVELGRRLGLNVRCALSYGGQPVGRAIGPALEAKEALKTLEERKGSSSLIEKSLGLAGILLEMSGKTSNGYEYAKEIFNSGKAYEKLKEIILAQGGEITKADDVPIGDKVYTLKATKEGAVEEVYNKNIVKIARTAGAPKDKGAGVYLHKKRGEVVKVGDPIITIYAEKEWKLDNAIDVALQEKPVEITGMILDAYPSYKYIGGR